MAANRSDRVTHLGFLEDLGCPGIALRRGVRQRKPALDVLLEALVDGENVGSMSLHGLLIKPVEMQEGQGGEDERVWCSLRNAKTIHGDWPSEGAEVCARRGPEPDGDNN